MSPGDPNHPVQAAAAAAASATTTTQDEGLLDQILEQSKLTRDEPTRLQARDSIGEVVKQIMAGTMKGSKNVQALLNARIAQLDEMLSDQVNEILHHKDFQKIEAAWRGLHYFVHQTETGEDLQVRVLNVSQQELLDDLAEASDIDQSNLWKKIYEEEFGTFGGEPFGLLVGDFEFSKQPQDMFLLRKLSNVAAAAHAPFVSAAAPQMFGWESFTDMARHRDLSSVFEGDDSIEWRSFRETEDSRFVAMCLPHVLMRLPYGPDSAPARTFRFVEDVDGTEHDKYLWGNAAYALAARITGSYAKYHWCSAIRGVQGGGLVEDLPVHTFTTDEGDIASKCPTEIAITDRFENQFSELGFLPLLYQKHSDKAAFFGGQSAQKPKNYGARNPEANASASLSAELPYILSTSRFAHYLKSIMRDQIGGTKGRAEIERMLNDWITQYVTADENASMQVKAECPLREARVDVVSIEGKPGTYRAIAYLKPHFMLNKINVSLRLVADLPAPSQSG